ncbi:MAG: STAS domain-containing protein [Acidobacteriaceae bacterium]
MATRAVNPRNLSAIERLARGNSLHMSGGSLPTACAVNGRLIAILATAMLRITVIETSEGAAVLRVEGRITGYYVEELRRACDARASLDKIRLSLELADVSFADLTGIELLKDLRRRGVGLVQTTPFMTEQLKDGVSSDVTRVASDDIPM